MLTRRPPLIAPLLASLLALACGGQPARDGGVPPPITGPDGKPAETVRLQLDRFDGGTITLAELTRPADGPPRAVLVTYFTTWCMPCIEMLPHLDRLDRELDGLAVLAVNLDHSPKALLPSAIAYLDLQMPIALADEAHHQGYSPFGRFNAVPVAYLVDPQGRHVETFVGITPTDYLRRRVAELTEGTR